MYDAPHLPEMYHDMETRSAAERNRDGMTTPEDQTDSDDDRIAQMGEGEMDASDVQEDTGGEFE